MAALESIATAVNEAASATIEPNLQDLQEPPTDSNPEIARLKELLAQHPQGEKKRGTSHLEMQIGLFRLIQGAAYRSFRESFCANHETHLCVRDLPYRIADFVQFVRSTIALYKGLGVVESACNPLLDAVVKSVEDEYARLEHRIKNWKTIEKTPEMLAQEQAMLQARDKSATAKEKFAAGVELAMTIKKNSLNFTTPGCTRRQKHDARPQSPGTLRRTVRYCRLPRVRQQCGGLSVRAGHHLRWRDLIEDRGGYAARP